MIFVDYKLRIPFAFVQNCAGAASNAYVMIFDLNM
jgi:hypothetical protein